MPTCRQKSWDLTLHPRLQVLHKFKTWPRFLEKATSIEEIDQRLILHAGSIRERFNLVLEAGSDPTIFANVLSTK